MDTGCPPPAWSRSRAGCPPAARRRRRHPVRQPGQPGAALRPGPYPLNPADPVVADLHRQPPGKPADAHLGGAGPGVLGHVGQRLADHEVGGGLDHRGESLTRHLGDRGGHRRALGQRLDRPGQPGLGEHGGVDAAGQLPQLGQRLLRLLAGRLDQRLELGIDPGRAAAGHAERQGQRDQPLLRPVVQVPLESAAFGVSGLHDPGPGRPDQLQLGLDLGLQPGMLQGHARRRRGQPDQLRLEFQTRVADQYRLLRPGQRHHRPPRIRPRRVHRMARGVGEAVLAQERQLQRGIAQCPGQRVPGRPGGAPGSRSTIAVPSAPRAVLARTVLITNRTGPSMYTSGAQPLKTRLASGGSWNAAAASG